VSDSIASAFPATRSQPTRSGQLQVHLRVQKLSNLTQISTWSSSIGALSSALHRALDCAPPLHTGQLVPCALGTLMRSGPFEFLLVGDADHSPSDRVALLRQHINAETGSVLDLSHARVRVSVHGDKAVEALSRLYALDFRPAAFAADSFVLTGHHHIPCLLYRLDEQQFHAYYFTTYARGQIDLLADAALEFGVDVTHAG
jgi:heterotetrameric sarcosine oxidase gamma subunit